MSKEPKLILHLDGSPEGELLRRAVIRLGKPFSVLYAAEKPGDFVRRYPAIEGPFGIVYGWSNIKTYFDLPLD